MGLFSSTRLRNRPWNGRPEVVAMPQLAPFAPAAVQMQEGALDQPGDPIMPLLAQLVRQQVVPGADRRMAREVAATGASGQKPASGRAEVARRDAAPARRNSPGRFYSRRDELRKAAKDRRDDHIPVSPGLGLPMGVVGRAGSRVKAMSPAEFAEYERLQQSLAEFGDRWAEAGPVGGAPVDDEVQQHAAHAWDQYYKQRARGKSVEEAAAWAAMSDPESEGSYRAKQDGGGPGRGLYQWGHPNPKFDRRLVFEREMYVPIEQSTEAEQFGFRDWELANTHKGAQKAIEKAQTAGEKAAAMTRFYERPHNKDEKAKYRAALAEEIARRARIAENRGAGGRVLKGQ
jgi:hypothetical protein